MAKDPKIVLPASMQRIVRGVRYVIDGVSNAWMGPNQPLTPITQESKGRTWDYPVAFNLNYIPRATMALSFSQLRNLADNSGIIRTVIESRKDGIEATDWEIVPRKKNKQSVVATPDMEERIKAITKLLENPNKDLDWSQFLRQVLEQHFVYDAPSIEKVRNRRGDLCALKCLDGSTISVKLDEDGGTPRAPDVAYQQILKGMPAVDFSADELLYYPHNRRVGEAYGYPHVAQIYTYVQLTLQRAAEQAAAFAGANAPHGIMTAGPTMTVDQLTAMQRYWESMFKGNPENRAMTLWVPEGSEYTPLVKDILFNEFDEWLARVICYCFSVSPAPFVKAVNRATAEEANNQAHAEGARPTLKYLKRMMDRIITFDLNSPDLEFVWDEDSETDPEKQAVIDQNDVKAGIISIDEARAHRGKDARGGAFDSPMYATASGYVPVDPEEAAELQAKMNPPPVQIGPDGKPLPGREEGGKPSFGGKPKPGLPVAAKPFPPRKGALPMDQAAKALPAPAGGTFKAIAKADMPAALYTVERELVAPGELVDWAKGLGLKVPDRLSMSLLTTDEPSVAGVPFVMADRPRLAKTADGFRLYFDCLPLEMRADEIGAPLPGDGFSILMGTSDSDVPEQEFGGDLMLGPEVITKRWDDKAYIGNHSPSAAQAKVGNYRMGALDFQGLLLAIETPKGAVRKGPDWQVKMPVHYGYIKGTIGADGDGVDCFVGPNPRAENVYVIDQHRHDNGAFDEHKVMLGFDSWMAAQKAYRESFTDNKHDIRIGSAQMMDMDQFKAWLGVSDTTKPIALAKNVTLATNLTFYDQGIGPDIPSNKQKGKKSRKESNDQVGEGEVPVPDKPTPELFKAETFTRWADY